jgi:hypothetical protein
VLAWASAPAVAYTTPDVRPHPAQAAVAQAATVPPPRPSVAGRPATGSPDAVGHDEPTPQPASAGSASASPGGGLTAVGLASLAALLIGFALPRLLSRVHLAPGRAHAVALVLALERPD